MSATTRSAPFSKAVFRAMRALYPEDLAEKSWDNTGLLLEAPFDPVRRQMNSVLLTIDLTKAVADEAIERKDSVIVAYHPIIFRGLKALTLDDSQQQSLLRLAAEGISVYSPHTAVDAAKGGMNDWLADIVTGVSSYQPESSQPQRSISEQVTGTKRPTYQLFHQPSQASFHEMDYQVEELQHTRTVITPSTLESHPEAGGGRIVRFKEPQPLFVLIERISKGMGNPKGFPLAIPQATPVHEIRVSSVAICVGSGGAMLGNLKNVDLLLTGEMHHHEALAAIERGQCVVTLFHSNSERGFLHAVLKRQLRKRLREEWNAQRIEEKKAANLSEEMLEALNDEEVQVDVSLRDKDPFGLVLEAEHIPHLG